MDKKNNNPNLEIIEEKNICYYNRIKELLKREENDLKRHIIRKTFNWNNINNIEYITKWAKQHGWILNRLKKTIERISITMQNLHSKYDKNVTPKDNKNK